MYLKRIYLGLLICLVSFHGMAQTEKPIKVKKHRFSFYGGVGPSYFFNNLYTSKDKVNTLNYSVVGRFMWEPPFFLSLGIETGYFQLYTVNYDQPVSAHVTNAAIPLQMVVSMKLMKNYYFNFAMGQSLLINNASAEGYGNFDARNWSLADFSATFGYKHKFESRISIGAETKLFISSGYNNATLALIFMGGYNF